MSIRIYTKKEGSILENPACCCSLSGIGVSARVLGRKVSGVDDDAAQKEEGRKREEKKSCIRFHSCRSGISPSGVLWTNKNKWSLNETLFEARCFSGFSRAFDRKIEKIVYRRDIGL